MSATPARGQAGAGNRARRRGALVALAAVVVLVGAAAGVVAGVLVNGKPGQGAAVGSSPTPAAMATADATPQASPESPSPAPTDTAPPTEKPGEDAEQSVPADYLRVVPRDPLTAPGRWKVRDPEPEHQVSCGFDGGLVLTSQKAVNYRCPGPKDAITGTAVFVTVTLNRSNSCAAVWFRFTVATGGYAVRICEDGYFLVVHRSDGQVEPLRTMLPAAPLNVDDPTRIGIVMDGAAIRVYQDGDLVDEWSNPRFTEGQVHLGLLQSPGTEPPFQVTFSDVEVWGEPAV
jgi:hypothetical protein